MRIILAVDFSDKLKELSFQFQFDNLHAAHTVGLFHNFIVKYDADVEGKVG